jgi:hypothetical protein
MLDAGEAERLSGREVARADFERVRAETIELGLTPDMDPHTNRTLRQAIASDAQYILRTGQANDLEDLMEMLTREWDIAPGNRQGVREAVRQAMANNGGRSRFRDGEYLDEDYYTYGILVNESEGAANSLAGAGASPEEMAYTLNMLGHRPGAIHTSLTRHFGQTVEDQTRHAALIEKISGENPFPGGLVGEPTPTAVPDPTPPSPGVAALHTTTPENMLPDLRTLNERQLSAIYTMLDTSRTYESAYGGPPRPDGIRDMLQSAGYNAGEIDTAMGYFGRQDLVDDFVRRTLSDMGWTPGAQVPVDDLNNAMESEGLSAGFRDTILRFVQDFASDESGSKVIGKATRPRASDEARIEEGYRAYQELGGRSDYQIRSMLSQEGFDFDAIEAVGERLTGRSYREARGASHVPEPEPNAPSGGRYRTGDFTSDYPDQARRAAREQGAESFLDTHTGRDIPTAQAPLQAGTPLLPPPAEGTERYYRGVAERTNLARPSLRRLGDDTRGRWFASDERMARGYGQQGQVHPSRWAEDPDLRGGAILAADVPEGTQLGFPRGKGPGTSFDYPHYRHLMPEEHLPDVRLYRGSGLVGVRDNPNALYPRPDPRKALLPSLLGGAYLGMRDGRNEEPTPKRRRLLDF